jgi:hypothetical protein
MDLCPMKIRLIIRWVPCYVSLSQVRMLLPTAYTDVVTLLSSHQMRSPKIFSPPFGIDTAHECRVARSHELGHDGCGS